MRMRCARRGRLNPEMPYAPFQLGYLSLMKGDYPAAQRYYAATLENFTALEQLLVQWKTFPSIRESIQQEHAQALQHWKIVQEHSRFSLKNKKTFDVTPTKVGHPVHGV